MSISRYTRSRRLRAVFSVSYALTLPLGSTTPSCGVSQIVDPRHRTELTQPIQGDSLEIQYDRPRISQVNVVSMLGYVPRHDTRSLWGRPRGYPPYGPDSGGAINQSLGQHSVSCLSIVLYSRTWPRDKLILRVLAPAAVYARVGCDPCVSSSRLLRRLTDPTPESHGWM